MSCSFIIGDEVRTPDNRVLTVGAIRPWAKETRYDVLLIRNDDFHGWYEETQLKLVKPYPNPGDIYTHECDEDEIDYVVMAVTNTDVKISWYSEDRGDYQVTWISHKRLSEHKLRHRTTTISLAPEIVYEELDIKDALFESIFG